MFEGSTIITGIEEKSSATCRKKKDSRKSVGNAVLVITLSKNSARYFLNYIK